MNKVDPGGTAARRRSMTSLCVEDQFHKVAKLGFAEHRVIRYFLNRLRIPDRRIVIHRVHDD